MTVAERLKDSSAEAELRTSIGRSYYALFISLRDALMTAGVRFARDGQDHRRLPSYLHRANSREAAAIAQTLQNLRGQRELSDYEMQQEITKRDAEVALGRATSARDRFDREAVRLVPILRALVPDPPLPRY